MSNGKDMPLYGRTIAQIYNLNQEADTVDYQIPIYQRNYAWERTQIETLIKDVVDSMEQEVYYIGTLVTYFQDNNVHEVIDGQQRLTTIFLILNALGEKSAQNKLTYKSRGASKKALDTIINGSTSEIKYSEKQSKGLVDNGILYGYSIAVNAINKLVKPEDKEKFKNFFLHKVMLIHYQVPMDVDLNHYFEVMNSRGEQLEKHEIVKALMCGILKDNPTARTRFSEIWEACSDMGFFVQQKYKTDREKVFGKDLTEFCNDISILFPESDIKVENKEELQDQNSRKTIKDLMYGTTGKEPEDDKGNKDNKFTPIVDFPDFLLIVLKITRILDENDKEFSTNDFILNDKALISEFKKVITKQTDGNYVKKFGFNLLKAKYLLDNYIVHHIVEEETNTENPWKLQCFYKNSSDEYPRELFSYKDSQGNSVGDKNIQDELVQLLSMFEVTYSEKDNKNYLFYCLLYLFTALDEIESKVIDGRNYLEFLQNMADKYFYDIYLNQDNLVNNRPKPGCFDQTMVVDRKLSCIQTNNNKGTVENKNMFTKLYPLNNSNIALYVFNYTDYKLWKLYLDKLRGQGIPKGTGIRKILFERMGCSDFELNVFDRFYFTRTRRSLEHFYPQAKAISDKDYEAWDIEKKNRYVSESRINCFGNFAMISSEANSSGSNWAPSTKLSHYTDTKKPGRGIGVGSLKFKIMMQMCYDNEVKLGSDERGIELEWLGKDIEIHQENMLNILFGKTEEL